MTCKFPRGISDEFHDALFLQDKAAESGKSEGETAGGSEGDQGQVRIIISFHDSKNDGMIQGKRVLPKWMVQDADAPPSPAEEAMDVDRGEKASMDEASAEVETAAETATAKGARGRGRGRGGARGRTSARTAAATAAKSTNATAPTEVNPG